MTTITDAFFINNDVQIVLILKLIVKNVPNIIQGLVYLRLNTLMNGKNNKSLSTMKHAVGNYKILKEFPLLGTRF